jgi:transposase
VTHPVIIGIDTHKASHVAVAIDTQGTRLAALECPIKWSILNVNA